MTVEQIETMQQAVKMLISAYDDVSQTLQEFSKEKIDEQEFNEAEGFIRVQWIPADGEIMPENGKKVCVKTKSGAVYAGTTYNGKFMKDVVAWFPIPD